jgi:hypothetical protein
VINIKSFRSFEPGIFDQNALFEPHPKWWPWRSMEPSCIVLLHIRFLARVIIIRISRYSYIDVFCLLCQVR